MKAVNVDDVLKILHKYGEYIFVTDMKKYSSMVDKIANLKPLPQETVTEFADRCKECGARYGKLLKQKSDMLDKIKEEIEAQSRMHMDGDLYIKVSECMQIIDKYKGGGDPDERKTES